MKQRGMETRYEEVVHEYSVLLTGQLEVQRAHFEAMLSKAERAHSTQLAELQHQVTGQASELSRVRDLLGRESKEANKRVSASDAQLARARKEVRCPVPTRSRAPPPLFSLLADGTAPTAARAE